MFVGCFVCVCCKLRLISQQPDRETCKSSSHLIGRIAYTQCVGCGLLLQMSHVAWSVCLSVLGTRVSCAKTAEPIEMPFGGLTVVGPRNHYWMGVYIPRGKGRFLRGSVFEKTCSTTQ